MLEKLLDKGEASSIALAIENRNSLLIIDEMKGRKVAQSFQLDLIGTIGVLVTASEKGIITDTMSVIFELINEGFRISDRLMNRLKKKYGEQ